jgi:hypothetical protein
MTIQRLAEKVADRQGAKPPRWTAFDETFDVDKLR